MKELIYYVVPVLVFALINFWVVFAGKKTFGISLPATLIGSAVVTYLGQLVFHTFSVGFWACLVLAVSAVGLLIVKRKDKDFIARCFSEGFVVFLILCLFFLVLDFRRYFSSWDELSHWGKMVKEMIRLDRFYSEPQSNLLVHKEYPPLAAIFEMLWCRFTGGYREGRATMALHVFEFSLVVPMAMELFGTSAKMGKWQKFVGQVALFLTFVWITLHFDYVEFNTIYTDLFLPLFYVFLICVLADKKLRESGFGFILLLLGQFGLMLSKQMSIAYVLLVWFFYSITLWSDRKRAGYDRKQKLMDLGRSLAVLVVPAISYLIWNRYTKALGLTGQFALDQIDLKTVVSILRGGGSDVQHLTYVNYVKALFSTNIGMGVFGISYLSAALLALCLLAVLAYAFRRETEKGEMLRYGLLFLLGSVGYAVTMFVLYMFCYSEAEMRRLASYQRYMDSYMVSQYLILFLLLLHLLKRKGKNICSYQIACGMFGIAVLSLGMEPLADVMPQMLKEEPMYGYRIRAERIQARTDSGDRIFLVSSDNCANMYYLNYFLEDRQMDDRYLYSDVAEQSAADENYWNTVLACIRENDYVYIYNETDNVDQKLGTYTAEDILPEDTLYRVVAEGDGLRLESAE